jgi:hypothetical protein
MLSPDYEWIVSGDLVLQQFAVLEATVKRGQCKEVIGRWRSGPNSGANRRENGSAVFHAPRRVP